LILIRRTAREAVQGGLVPYIKRALDSTEMQRCEQAPENWSLELPRSTHVDAYDGATLLSRNPASPPLDLGLYRRLQRGEVSPVELSRFEGEHVSALVIRAAPSGPCSIIQVTWAPHPFRRRRLFYLLLTGALVVGAAAAALGVFFVVQPLTRRIARLRAAAGAVGAENAYVSPADPASDEIGELSSSLDRAHERIRADADRLVLRQQALERYLADIAHDLKTPISSLQIALEQAAEQASGDVAELIRSSLKDVIYLDALTTNLRLACRLREGWNPSEGDPIVDLRETVERVVARARYFAKNRGMLLEAAHPDAAVYARCHPTAAEQAITNLIENAIAYGDQGGHVAVVLESDGSHPRFTLVVADDGPGVLPAELPRLGERTFRSDEARQRDPSGSGLGLAITSEICGRCGWQLSFERQEPRGLKVEIAGTTIPDPGIAPDKASRATGPLRITPPTTVPPAQGRSRG
jgi:signal transduction histidine kinase